MPCVIYLHANGCNRLEGLQFMELILNSEMSLFCFDFTACGKSEGQYSSIGWFEQNDIESAVQYLISTGRIDKIALWGRSMGAVAAVLYAENDPGITCIVVDSCFMSFKLLVKEIAKNKASIPGFIASGAFSVLRKTIKKKANFDLNNIKPIKVVEKIKIPSLFGHGSKDTLIPCEHTKELHKKYGGLKQIIIFEGDHNSPRPVNFVLMIREFLKKHLLGDKKSESIMTKKSKIHVYSTGFGIKNKIIAKTNDVDMTHEKITHLLTQRNNIQSSQIIDTDRQITTERGNYNREIVNNHVSPKLEAFTSNNSNEPKKIRHYRYSSLLSDDNSLKNPELNKTSILFGDDPNTLYDKNNKNQDNSIILNEKDYVKAYSQADLNNKLNVKQISSLTEKMQKSQLLNIPAAQFINNNCYSTNHGKVISRLYGPPPIDQISSSSDLDSILYTQRGNNVFTSGNLDKKPPFKESNTLFSSTSKITGISNVNQLKSTTSQLSTSQVYINPDLSPSSIIYKKTNSRDIPQAKNIRSHAEIKILNQNLDPNHKSKPNKLNLDISNQNLLAEQQTLLSPSYMFRNPLINSASEKPGKNFFDFSGANNDKFGNINNSKANISIFNNDLLILENGSLQSPIKNASKIVDNFSLNNHLDSRKKDDLNSYNSNSPNKNIVITRSSINNYELLEKSPISYHNAIPVNLKYNDNYTDLKFDQTNSSQYNSSQYNSSQYYSPSKLQYENGNIPQKREIFYSSRNELYQNKTNLVVYDSEK